NAPAAVSAPIIITCVDEPVSKVEELSRNVRFLLRESRNKGKEAKFLKSEMNQLGKQMGSWEKDFKNEAWYVLRIDKMLDEETNKGLERDEEMKEMKERMKEMEGMKERMEEMQSKWELMDYKYEMMARDKEQLEMALANVHMMMSDRLGWNDMDERPSDAIDVLKTYGTTQPPGLQDLSNDP
ncbi:hypothetical protein Tco_0141874, partial [Tanacetum coccineum]